MRLFGKIRKKGFFWRKNAKKAKEPRLNFQRVRELRASHASTLFLRERISQVAFWPFSTRGGYIRRRPSFCDALLQLDANKYKKGQERARKGKKGQERARKGEKGQEGARKGEKGESSRAFARSPLFLRRGYASACFDRLRCAGVLLARGKEGKGKLQGKKLANVKVLLKLARRAVGGRVENWGLKLCRMHRFFCRKNLGKQEGKKWTFLARGKLNLLFKKCEKSVCEKWRIFERTAKKSSALQRLVVNVIYLLRVPRL